jgi:ABC-2 type transport system permease protein
MKKFIAFSRITWQNSLTYRAESLVWFALEALPLVYMLSLWQSLEKSGRLSQAESSKLIVYFILSLVISRLTSTHFEEWVIPEIKDGNISKSLLKPFSYIHYLLANSLTWKIFGIVYLVPSAVLLYPTLSNLTGIYIYPAELLIFTFILVIAFIQRFCVSWLICLTAFWLDQSKSLMHFKWMMEGIFGGAWLPLYFFPEWFQKIAQWTPFYSWYYLPIQFFNHNLSLEDITRPVILSVLWVVVLISLGKLFWKRSLARYSSVGG